MSEITGNNYDLRSGGEKKRLCGKDDINIEIERRRSRSPLLAGSCPKLGCEPESLVV
jgi:hypothetical protein